MTTVILVRHGRTKANSDGVLAGWSPGVFLDELGEKQAIAAGSRLAGVKLAAIISSPLERTMQTADAIAEAQLLSPWAGEVQRHTDDRVGECRYGTWTGAALKDLMKEPMWKVVQSHPSAAVFPGEGGEAMSAMQHRAVSAVREWNERLGAEATYVIVSHGDVIKAILADAMGMHLDQFQRISVDPCSISIINYTSTRPFILRTNDTGADLATLFTKKKARGKKMSASGDAVVGGGAG